MRNIEYLTERDLKYFEKKEALGEAIIIRIDPGVLLSLDLDALFQERNRDQTLTVQELESLFHADERNRESRRNPMQLEEGGTNRLENDLQKADIPENVRLAFLQAVRAGASDEELMELLGNENTEL